MRAADRTLLEWAGEEGVAAVLRHSLERSSLVRLANARRVNVPGMRNQSVPADRLAAALAAKFAKEEASRRTLLSAQDAMQMARTYLEESLEANRTLFNAYTRGFEAAIRGRFEIQNAMFAAGMSLLDASTTSSRNVAQQWTEARRQAQQARLQVWQAGVSTGDGLLASVSSGELSGQEDKGRKR